MTTARKLGISLAIGCLLLPFVACAGAFFMLDDELSMASIALSALLSLPFFFGTFAYAAIATKRCLALPRKHALPRLVLFVPLGGIIAWAAYANATPRRITPDTVSDSPFDKYWYSAPQTAYGKPLPYLRFFDDAVPDSGYPEIRDSLFDVSSLLGNLTVWTFVVFVVVSLAYTLLPPRMSAKSGKGHRCR